MFADMRGLGATGRVGTHAQWKWQPLSSLAFFAPVAAGAHRVLPGDSSSSSVSREPKLLSIRPITTDGSARMYWCKFGCVWTLVMVYQKSWGVARALQVGWSLVFLCWHAAAPTQWCGSLILDLPTLSYCSCMSKFHLYSAIPASSDMGLLEFPSLLSSFSM